jgi:hypothetical protein
MAPSYSLAGPQGNGGVGRVPADVLVWMRDAHHVMRMSEKKMTVHSLALSDVSPQEAVQRLQELDPAERYTVFVAPATPKQEAIRRLREKLAAQAPDPALTGLTEDQIMDLGIGEIAAHRAERQATKASE